LQFARASSQQQGVAGRNSILIQPGHHTIKINHFLIPHTMSLTIILMMSRALTPYGAAREHLQGGIRS
jgi:hypothetical protein